jgi:site-specific DNA recombinase
MNAAIYARKSTDEPGRATEQKSVVRQQELALAFAVKQGWTVRDEHVFVDDDISGAEFKRRPGLQRLLAALTPRAPFQRLIVSEQKSIGREMSETGMVIKDLAMAGVEIFEYGHGQSLTPKNYIEKMMSAFRAGADEAHREQTAERVHEAHTRSVKSGYVVGGRVFGYRNRKVFNGTDIHGNELYSHTERVIEPSEAAVIQRIFEMYDSGFGLKRIATQLTREKATSPIPFVRRDPTKVLPVMGWSPSTVGAILARDLYHGVLVWNRSQKRPATSWGQVKQGPRPESDWIYSEAEQLRIIDEQLWKRVQSRRRLTEGKALRFEGGRLSGRPPKNGSRNLLAGLATCAHCGGGLIVETSARKRGRVPEYVCARRRMNGNCTNALRMPMAEVDEGVLQAVEQHALTPEAIEGVIHLTERDEVQDHKAALESERKEIERRIANITAAIEKDGLGSLLKRLRELEDRRNAIDVELRNLRPIPRLAPEVIENRLAEWRRLLRSSKTQARAVLQRILPGRLTFTLRRNEVSGEIDGYEFEGPTRFDGLFTGIAVERPKNLDPNDLTGTEDITPDDTLEGEYSRLLEQAYSAGSHALRGTSPRGSASRWKRATPWPFQKVSGLAA